MAQQPLNQGPVLPQKPRTPSRLAGMIGEYVKAFVRIVFWAVIAVVVGGLAFIAIKAVIFAVQLVLEAVGA